MTTHSNEIVFRAIRRLLMYTFSGDVIFSPKFGDYTLHGIVEKLSADYAAAHGPRPIFGLWSVGQFDEDVNKCL